MADWPERFDVPQHEGTASVAGYRFIGDVWNDVERGATPLQDHPESYLSAVEGFTYHYVNAHGDDVHFHVSGPFDSWEDLADAIGESLDRYGIA